MDIEGIKLSKLSQTDRQILYDFTYIWNLKKNERIDTENRQVVARVREWGKQVKRVKVSPKRYKVPVIR